jgi:hypothetical protein
MRRWSGDHIVDPEAVPGILFMNRNLSSAPARAGTPVPPQSNLGAPHIIDLAPTILNHLGVAIPPAMEGNSLL